MRITGGAWCGRKIAVPDSTKVRPTQDRVREALFSILMYVVPEARVLDLYAGSGAFGLDAMSHGAKTAHFVESDKKCFNTLSRNLATFGLDAKQCAVQAEVMRWVKAVQGQQFDLVFADPPYRLAYDEGFEALAAVLIERDLIPLGGVLVVETHDDTQARPLQGFECLRERIYGHTKIAVYQRPRLEAEEAK